MLSLGVAGLRPISPQSNSETPGNRGGFAAGAGKCTADMGELKEGQEDFQGSQRSGRGTARLFTCQPASPRR